MEMSIEFLLRPHGYQACQPERTFMAPSYHSNHQYTPLQTAECSAKAASPAGVLSSIEDGLEKRITGIAEQVSFIRNMVDSVLGCEPSACNEAKDRKPEGHAGRIAVALDTLECIERELRNEVSRLARICG